MFRTMALAGGLAVLVSVLVAPWRVVIGLLIGGLLALVNHRWLVASTSAAFAVLVEGKKPQLTIGKYALRYLIVGATVFTAYKFGIASLPALFAGLCSFVVALFFEASREFYFAITHGGETN
jgi:ATP synthase I chain